MAAPAGNQFWKLGTQNGRPRLFKNPQELWDYACEYFAWCDENPIETLEFHGKDATECIVPKMRAYTWSGLEYYLDINSLRDYKTQYKEFAQIITRIEKVLYTQKFEGAAAGVLNANIISRDLGLIDRQENNVSGTGIKIITGREPEAPAEGLEVTTNE